MQTRYNGRLVEYEIEFGTEPEDSYIHSAYYLDTEDELSDVEHEALQESEAETLYEKWYQHQVAYAYAEHLNDLKEGR